MSGDDPRSKCGCNTTRWLLKRRSSLASLSLLLFYRSDSLDDGRGKPFQRLRYLILSHISTFVSCAGQNPGSLSPSCRGLLVATDY
jgi:hypothetical protein